MQIKTTKIPLHTHQDDYYPKTKTKTTTGVNKNVKKLESVGIAGGM